MSRVTTPLPALAAFDRDVCADLGRALDLEWLETDGLGGYATSTIVHCPTRRYHGLFVAAPPGSVERHVFLSRYEEEATALASGARAALSVACYADTFAPEGHRSAERFELAPFPRSAHRVGGAEITREVLLVRGASISLCRWSVEGDEAVELALRPFLPCRPADALTVQNDALDESVRRAEGSVSARPYAALPAVVLSWGEASASFELEPVWYLGLRYAADEARGYAGREDQWTPGFLRARLEPGEALVVAASLDEPVDRPDALWDVESEVRREDPGAGPRIPSGIGMHRCGSTPAPRPAPRQLAGAPAPRQLAGANDLFDRASLAAEAFLYRDPSDRLGVIAGYPWFGEWGRDTFVALPGLTLARGRPRECAEALEGAVAWLHRGLLPNVFGAGVETSHYGSADAALWFARAVRLYADAAHDRERMLGTFHPALASIAEACLEGTGVLSVDEGGCLAAGDASTNLTWMDAVTAEGPVTPRHGCAVEVNALWYSLLAHLEELAGTLGDRAARKRWTQARRLLRRTFLERFWVEERGILADVWRDGERDLSVRPNMVIAAALEKSPLTRAQRRRIVGRATADLLTPRGLRTLAPSAPGYAGRYGGGPVERDAAYHQGTVWPWLLGFYVEARLRAEGDRRALKAELAKLWRGMEEETRRAGLGHLSEVFDGDPPHRPGGTIAQAWNTAECLRSLALLRAPIR